MQQTPDNWQQLSGKFIWPDRVIYHEDDSGNLQAIFVIDKLNNRQLTSDRAMMVRLMERVGLTVRLATNGYLFTIDEFNAEANYKARVTGVSKQQAYNARSELNQLVDMLLQELAVEPNNVERIAKLRDQIEAKKKKATLMAEIAKVAQPTSTTTNELVPLPIATAATALVNLDKRLREMGLPTEKCDQLLQEYTDLQMKGESRDTAEQTVIDKAIDFKLTTAAGGNQ